MLRCNFLKIINSGSFCLSDVPTIFGLSQIETTMIRLQPPNYHEYKIRKWLSIIVMLPMPAFPHGGGVDSNGGHLNRKTGQYHCHHAGCIAPSAAVQSAQQQSKAAQKEAQHDAHPYSLTYNRRDWPHWIDADGDCQDTRAEILQATSQKPVQYRNAKRCSVVGGQWFDPYTEKTWSNASDVDLDHVVPLKWAHTHGGSNWPKSKKREFANDPANLIPVEDNVNQGKGDKGPSDWMPPRQTYRCEYLTRFNAIVARYALQPTPAEKRVMNRMRTACH